MTQQIAVAEWKTDHGMVSIDTYDTLRQLFRCPNATDFEIEHFTRLCAAQALNPFLRDAYIIKYGNNPAQIVIGREAYSRRAEQHPHYDGIESGIIVERAGQIVEQVGTFRLDGDVVAGGWAKVYRKDRSRPFTVTVSFAEYTTRNNLWNSKPGTMIQKVAMVQALREAFPNSFSGLYDEDEVNTPEASFDDAVATLHVESKPVIENNAPLVQTDVGVVDGNTGEIIDQEPATVAPEAPPPPTEEEAPANQQELIPPQQGQMVQQPTATRLNMARRYLANTKAHADKPEAPPLSRTNYNTMIKALKVGGPEEKIVFGSALTTWLRKDAERTVAQAIVMMLEHVIAEEEANGG